MILLISCNRNNAEEALPKLNGTVIGKQTVRLSWGRNPANKQALILSLLINTIPKTKPNFVMFGCFL